jgi:hypothetical protein
MDHRPALPVPVSENVYHSFLRGFIQFSCDQTFSVSAKPSGHILGAFSGRSDRLYMAMPIQLSPAHAAVSLPLPQMTTSRSIIALSYVSTAADLEFKAWDVYYVKNRPQVSALGPRG